MTRAIIAESVRILREKSLRAGSLSWEAYLAGQYLLAANRDRESDNLWQRSEEVARAEVVEVSPC